MVNAKIVVGLAVSALVVIIILAVAPMIGSVIDDADNTQDAVYATGTFTSTTNLSKAEMDANTTSVNISTETYVFTNGTTAAFDVDLSSSGNNSSQLIARLVVVINTDSTLVSAVDNGDNSTLITALVASEAANAYATTDNGTGQAWTAALMSGGITPSDWSPDSDSGIENPAQTWITFVGLIILAFLAVIIGLVIKGFKDMGED